MIYLHFIFRFYPEMTSSDLVNLNLTTGTFLQNKITDHYVVLVFLCQSGILSKCDLDLWCLCYKNNMIMTLKKLGTPGIEFRQTVCKPLLDFSYDMI